MMQLGPDPQEAAQIAGASWFRRMAMIVIPIHKSSLVTGVLLPFTSGIKGLSLFVMLAIPGTDVLTTFSLRLIDYHYPGWTHTKLALIASGTDSRNTARLFAHSDPRIRGHPINCAPET